MAKPGKRWRVMHAGAELAARLARVLEVSPVVAQVMVNRGISDEEEARRFLHGGPESLPDPNLMLGMARAVERIVAALDGGEKIIVYGDYDVDGVTATALLYRVLTRLGGAVDYYIPERLNEGYGLNAAALESLCQSGTKLVITVDCGISAAEEVAVFAGRMDIIVTDHHEPPDSLPPVYAVINPKQNGCNYPEKNLAGVGVAFKLCQALWRRLICDEEQLYELLDLVAIGTIADIVPLTGENRLLVKLGLARMATTANAGLQAMMNVAGLTADKLDTGKVGFFIVPRLNAAGRLSHATAGVELLITGDGVRAAELAAELDAENSRRQAVEKELLAAAEAMLADTDPAAQKVLVLAGEDWHPGVIGIVASRLLDRYYRPVVMISVRDGIGKGSCRSIPGFNIYNALGQCADLLLQFGGHQYAAGLTIDAANIDRLRERLSAIAAETLTAEDYQPVLDIDTRVALSEIDAALLQQLACLAPHGTGNPSPVFVCEQLAVTGVRPIGQDGRHLKLQVRRERANGEVIGWNMGEWTASLTGNATIDLAFAPEFNEWQGQRSIRLKAHDVRVRPAAPEQVRLIDARGENKKAYLRKVLPASSKTIIVVASRREAVLLTRKLGLPPGEAGWWYPAMGAVREERLRKRFASGSQRVVIAAGDYGGSDNDITDIIFCGLPLTKAALAAYFRLATAQKGPVAIHFAFGAADERAAGLVLEDLYPDRQAVGWLYLALREAAGPDGAVRLPPRRLARTVAAKRGQSIDPAGLAAGITVLTEIGLVRRDGNTADQLWLSPVPKAKLALEQSAAFREGVAARQRYGAFASRLLRAPLGEVWKMAIDGE